MTDIIVPEDITQLNGTFAGCKYIKSIIIPNSVTSIGSGTFCDCSSLTEITLPNSIKYIGGNVFNGCSALRKINLSDSLEKIGNNAFLGCTELNEITLPYTLKSIGHPSFSGCTQLSNIVSLNPVPPYTTGPLSYDTSFFEKTKLYIPESGITAYIGAPGWNEFITVNGYNVNICTDNTFKYKVIESPNFKEAVLIKSNYKDYNYSDVYIPEGFYDNTDETNPTYYTITAIGEEAFFGCDNLHNISFPLNSKIRTIGQSAFEYCTKLDEINLPNSVTTISASAFSQCDKLTNLILPNSVTTIGRAAFFECYKLKNLTLGSSLLEIGNYAFDGTRVNEIIFPPNIESIGDYSFAYNPDLKTIILGHKISSIGERAFDNVPAEKIYTTAQTPPFADNNTFSSYSGILYLQDSGDGAVIDAYRNASSCWNNFESHEMIIPEKIECNLNKIEGNPGESFQLTAKVLPENVTLPQIFWHSTNPEVAIVDTNGLVTIVGSSNKDISQNEQHAQSCNIIAETLYANGPTLEVTVYDNSANIDNISDDLISETDINYSAPYNVYTLQGILAGRNIDDLSAGIYIIRQNRLAKKIVIR